MEKRLRTVVRRRFYPPADGGGGSPDPLLHPLRERHEIGHRQLFGALREKGMLRPAEIAEGGAQRIAQHLAPLTERSLDHAHEQPLVARQPHDAVAAQADDGAFDLGRRVEDLLPYREEVLDVVPRLQQHREDAVLLRSGRAGDPLGHLALDHAHALGDKVAMLQHLEKNLRRDVVREISDHTHSVGKQRAQLHAQEIARHEPRRKFGIVGTEVVDALGVDLGAPHDDVAAPQQELRQHAHAASHLQHRRRASAVPPDRASQILRAMFRSTRKCWPKAFFALTSPTRQSFYGIRRRTARRRTAKVTISTRLFAATALFY